ncbi:MAG TPA: 50S ribosomal protein L22 [Candidatus Dormibacteraeota bacterium]|nr:50S ribosomal protein L22 [Candidatus Dormibacteraeota bacterium]
MEVQARAKWVRTSPRKVRLVAQTLRNLPVSEALVACQFMPRAAARDVAKVIRSAQANAENNFNLVRDDLVVKDIRVEPGPMLKRGQPRAMGRLFSIFKRTSHITAIVEDRPGVVRRRTAALPRAPQPTAARPAPTPAAAAAARAAAEPATTESDEREAPRPRRAKAEAKAETAQASKTAETGKKTEAKTSEAKRAEAKKTGKASDEKAGRGRAEGKKKDSQEKSK